MLQPSDVLKEFEFSQTSILDGAWINSWTKVNLAKPWERSMMWYFAFNDEDPRAKQYWGSVLGRNDSFIRVVQDGLNELSRRVLPFSYGVVQPTGKYDCPTAALTTITRWWYRKDIALPLPSSTELQWPELLLAFQVSPAMREAVAYRWKQPTAVNEPIVPPYYQYRWVIPNPQQQYSPPSVPVGCSAFSPEVQGFAESGRTLPTPQLPTDLLPPIPGEILPSLPPTVEPITSTKTTAQTNEPTWAKPVGIAAAVGLMAYLVWSVAKEK